MDTNGDNHIETLELWHHDPIKCIVELLGNLFFLANNSTHLSGYLGIKMGQIRNLERCGVLIGGGKYK